MSKRMTRRQLLRSLGLVAGAGVLVACQPKTVVVKETVKETVVVEKERVVKETVVVEGTPKVVEKVVKETVVVEKPVVATPVPAKAVGLRVHTRSGPEEKFHNSRARLFEEEHPNIKVKVESFPGSMYFTKILSMARTQTVGDVVFTNLAGGRMMQWSHAGVFLPLSGYTVADPEFVEEDYFPAALEAFTFEGVLHALPEKAGANAALLFYNQDAFDEAGIAHPSDEWSVDDLVEAGLELTVDTNGDGRLDQWGFAPNLGHNAYIVDMRIFGGELIDKEGRETLIDSDESRAAIKWLADLFLEHEIAPTAEQLDLSAGDAWYAGLVAMWQRDIMGPDTLRKLVGDKFEPGVARMPMGPTGKRGSMIGSTGLGISPHSRFRDEAWEWIKWMTNKETGVLRFEEAQSQPGARYDVYEDQRLLQHPEFQVFKKVVDGLMPWHIPWNFRAAEIISLVNNTMPKIWIEKAPVDAVIDELATEIRRILAMPRP